MGTSLHGHASCQRTARAKKPPIANQTNDENKNCKPMILWSVAKTYVVKNRTNALRCRGSEVKSWFAGVSAMLLGRIVCTLKFSEPLGILRHWNDAKSCVHFVVTPSTQFCTEDFKVTRSVCIEPRILNHAWHDVLL